MKGARSWAAVVFATTLSVVFAGCATEDLEGLSEGGDPVCGNAKCEAGESNFDCPDDCSACTGDACGTCGNGVVEPGENCDGDAFIKDCSEFGYKGGGVSCKADCTLDIASCCNDTCETIGSQQCNANVIESCNDSDQGCRLWQPTTNCADLGQGCSAVSGTPVCEGCVDGCPKEGESHCNGTQIETCKVGLTGCLAWSESQDCASTAQTCDDTKGSAECIGACANQCNILGETRCSGNDLQTCQTNGSCLYWATTEKCAATGGSCDTKTKKCVQGCPNQCAKEGLQTCIGGVVNTCKKDPKGCLIFEAGEDCKTKGAGWKCQLTGPQTAACEPDCTNPCPAVGAQRCQFNAMQTCSLVGTSCKVWTTVNTCPVGQTCSDTGGAPACVTAPITGEDCGTAWEVKAGKNTVNWVATKADHMIAKPSCGSSTLTGPDLVMRYDPTFNGSIDISITKPANNRWTMVVTDQTCGSMTPTLACVNEYSKPSMDAETPVKANQPVYIYLRDTTTGSQPLSNPLTVNITELDCSVFTGNATVVQPAHGSTTTTLSPNLEVTFDAAVNTSKGIITLKHGTTTLSYDLSLSPANLKWSNNNKTLVISSPALPAGANVTVSWTGLEDSTCKKPVTPPPWTFTVITPPCNPGTNGMVGGTVKRYSTGATTFLTEYYVEADADPAGWVYIGGTNALYRTKKTGGAWENVYAKAALSAGTVGYSMLVDDKNIYTLNKQTFGSTKRIFQISSDKGTSWSLVDYAKFPTSPFDDFQGATSYKGDIFAVTHESSTSQDTQIWRMPSTGTAPVDAVLEGSVLGQNYCGGLGVDDANFYVACGLSNRLVKVARSNGAVTLITDVWPLTTIAIGMASHDKDNDGKIDFIYYTGNTGDVYFVCDPGGVAYADKLATFSTSSSHYGLGFDPVAKQLYAYDSTTKELIVIQ